jgi:hypothetical protein
LAARKRPLVARRIPVRNVDVPHLARLCLQFEGVEHPRLFRRRRSRAASWRVAFSASESQTGHASQPQALCIHVWAQFFTLQLRPGPSLGVSTARRIPICCTMRKRFFPRSFRRCGTTRNSFSLSHIASPILSLAFAHFFVTFFFRAT